MFWYKQRFVGFNSRERSFQFLAQSKSWQQKVCLGLGVQFTFLDTDYFHKNFGMKKVWRTDSQELTLYQEWPVSNFPCYQRRILELGRTSIQETTGLKNSTQTNLIRPPDKPRRRVKDLNTLRMMV